LTPFFRDSTTENDMKRFVLTLATLRVNRLPRRPRGPHRCRLPAPFASSVERDALVSRNAATVNWLADDRFWYRLRTNSGWARSRRSVEEDANVCDATGSNRPGVR
jgi:hypothetical protein